MLEPRGRVQTSTPSPSIGMSPETVNPATPTAPRPKRRARCHATIPGSVPACDAELAGQLTVVLLEEPTQLVVVNPVHPHRAQQRPGGSARRLGARAWISVCRRHVSSLARPHESRRLHRRWRGRLDRGYPQQPSASMGSQPDLMPLEDEAHGPRRQSRWPRGHRPGRRQLVAGGRGSSRSVGAARRPTAREPRGG